jgi:Calcineurin-like phosphoesterase
MADQTNEPKSNDATHAPLSIRDKDFVRQVLLYEIKYRREKRWKVFSWTSGILLAAIGGVIALTIRSGFSNLSAVQRYSLAFALFVLTIYAALWLVLNYRKQRAVTRLLVSDIDQLKIVSKEANVRGFVDYWNRSLSYVVTILLVLTILLLWASAVLIIYSSASRSPPQSDKWYFAVSGDSRDCGDLIMPKIAQAIADNRRQAPVEFYWHLGDLRAIYRADCDMVKLVDSTKKCAQEDDKSNDLSPTDQYVAAAWPDFIANEIRPFEKAGIPFFLGIGNHEMIVPGNQNPTRELIEKRRNEFRWQFQEWLARPELQEQRQRDVLKKIDSNVGDTYFHFVMKGVDFIYLDNANIYEPPTPNKGDRYPGLTKEELNWLDKILSADETDESIRAVIVGMHAALPESISRDHAMDRTCASYCAGKQAYERLKTTQTKGKHVYILASHSHYFEQDVYNTSEHKDNVLPGWIIGTAGAEQYKPAIHYGYMLVEVRVDGTIRTSFEEVSRTSVPLLLSGPGAEQLASYCFEQNKRKEKKEETFKTASACTPCEQYQ